MAGSKRRILVIEDDRKTADLVRLYLESEGFQVLSAFDGTQGLDLAQKGKPDLVVLDLLLPGITGVEICRTLRRESDVPIIMLTALSSEKDKLEGLELGADDYVTKPFSPRELVARVRAVLRRTVDEVLDRGPSELLRGDLEMNVPQRIAKLRGEDVHLTPTEFRILATLAHEPGRVFSHLPRPAGVPLPLVDRGGRWDTILTALTGPWTSIS